MAHAATDTPGVSDLLLRTAGVTLLTKTIGKIEGVKVFSGKKPKADNAKAQKGSLGAMIVNERDIFNVTPPLRDGAVIKDKVTLLKGVFFEVKLF
jgi:hypothetical protein